MWKAKNNINYPTQWAIDPKLVDARTRSVQTESLIVVGKSLKLQSTFYSDAARVWNKAPDAIKNSKTLHSAKSEIRKFIITLPILTIGQVQIFHSAQIQFNLSKKFFA